MIIVNKKRVIIPVVLAFGVVMMFMLLGSTVAYLTDTEKGVNVITIGNVHLELSEPSYTEDSKVLSAGDSVVKNPVLTNTGTKDEFVFIEVAVPKRNVTLLYEDTVTGDNGHKEGTIINENGKPSQEEIYKLIADGVKNGAAAAYIVSSNYSELTDTLAPKTQPQLDFSYNKGSNSTAGWIYLSRELNKPEVENVDKYDYYYFGYNKALVKDDSTIPLFDRIQLKSFIDEELNSAEPENGIKPKNNEETKIIIKGYGIQADSLGIPNLDTSAFQTKDTLNKILNIVKEKRGE